MLSIVLQKKIVNYVFILILGSLSVFAFAPLLARLSMSIRSCFINVMFESLSHYTLWGLVAAFIQLSITVGVILRVMLTRHPPGSSFAWILITGMIPFAGFVLYLIFGERPIGQLRSKRYRALLLRHRKMHRQKLTPTGPLPQHLARHRTLIHLATRVSNQPVTFGSRLQLLSTTDTIFNAIINDINHAARSIHMEFYIWHSAGRVQAVADALIAAKKRGCSVRLLVDDFGSRGFLKGRHCEEFRRNGIEIAAAMPMRLAHLFGLQRADLRLHRKTIVIDGKIAYTGSLNMIDPLEYDVAKTVGAWVDAMVRIVGPAVPPLEKIFQIDWALQPDGNMSDHKPLPINRCTPQYGRGTVITVASGPYTSHDPNLYLLLETINNARFSLTITTPYFVPNEAMVAAILNAAYRGVRVKIILPQKTDSVLVGYAAKRYFDDLLQAGVKIFYYKGGLLHTKSISVDEEYAIFGTVNFDNRSIHLMFEMMLLIFDARFIADLNRLHQSYIAQSEPLEVNRWRKRPVLQRIKEGAAYLISPLL